MYYTINIASWVHLKPEKIGGGGGGVCVCVWKIIDNNTVYVKHIFSYIWSTFNLICKGRDQFYPLQPKLV
jgi:hypothetical protein